MFFFRREMEEVGSMRERGGSADLGGRTMG